MNIYNINKSKNVQIRCKIPFTTYILQPYSLKYLQIKFCYYSGNSIRHSITRLRLSERITRNFFICQVLGKVLSLIVWQVTVFVLRISNICSLQTNYQTVITKCPQSQHFQNANAMVVPHFLSFSPSCFILLDCHIHFITPPHTHSNIIVIIGRTFV